MFNKEKIERLEREVDDQWQVISALLDYCNLKVEWLIPYKKVEIVKIKKGEEKK